MGERLYNDPVTWKYGTESDYNRTRRHEPNEVFFSHDEDAGNRIYKGTEIFAQTDVFRTNRATYNRIRQDGKIQKNAWYIIVDQNDEIEAVHIGYTKIKDWNGEPFRMPFRF